MGVQSTDIFSTDIFTERVTYLMQRLSLSKKDMADRLNVDYSTFWRKLKGKRNVDIIVLLHIAHILGTSVSYLLGEIDTPARLDTLTFTAKSAKNATPLAESKEIKHQEKPGHLIFKRGEIYIDLPDTPSNQLLFRDLAVKLLTAELNAQKDKKQPDRQQNTQAGQQEKTQDNPQLILP